MFFLLPAVGAVVSFAAGAFVAHAVGEKDRQSAEQHKKAANQLIKDYSKLQQRYNELANESKTAVHDFQRKLASAEVDKDLLRLVLRLQQAQLKLILEIDKNPSQTALSEFKTAILTTNQILSQLNEQLIEIPNDYFKRNITRAKKLEKKEKSIIVTSQLQQMEYGNSETFVGSLLPPVSQHLYSVKEKMKKCSGSKRKKTLERYLRKSQ